MKQKPLIAISMGDPAGIGPEIIVKACSTKSVRAQIDPLIIGDEEIIKQTVDKLKKDMIVVTLGEIPRQPIKLKQLPVLQLPGRASKSRPGKWTAATGQRSFQAVALAVELAKQKAVDAIVTAPICKAAWQSAGLTYPGHTELLAELCREKDFAMMFVGGPFRLILVTIHQPLEKVPRLLTRALIEKMISIGARELKQRFGIKKPKIAIAGFNPHAGENGLFGQEEIKVITPAIQTMKRNKNMTITGPWPPDTLFAEAVHGAFDLIMCMYHDQGLIPFKMLALHEGVNVTAGLPIIRTSPDHGTAFEIAGKGRANPGSMIAAINTAIEMVRHSQ